MEYTSVIVNWSLILGAAAAAYFYYVTPNKTDKRKKPQVQTAEPTETNKAPKPKSKAKSKPPATQLDPVAPAPDSTTNEAIVEEEGDNAKEFALSLKKAQTGTDLKKNADAEKLKKNNKRGKKNAQTNGTNGQFNGEGQALDGTADAASSSVTSSQPDLEEKVSAFATGAAGMVSDFGTKVADTLRIYEEEAPAPVPREDAWTSVPTKNQKTQQKAAKQEESKKQRQRNAQKERERELKAEAEEQRRKLMEAQRRTARIARGEPAKNGERSFTEGPKPTKSAWNTASGVAAQPTNDHPSGADYSSSATTMLDTLDVPVDDYEMVSNTPTPVIASAEEGFDEPHSTSTEAQKSVMNGA